MFNRAVAYTVELIELALAIIVFFGIVVCWLLKHKPDVLWELKILALDRASPALFTQQLALIITASEEMYIPRVQSSISWKREGLIDVPPEKRYQV